MAIVKVNKIATTQVAGGVTSYGFVISTHSATDEFSFDDNVDIDTSTLSESEAAIVNNFITLVNEKLAL